MSLMKCPNCKSKIRLSVNYSDLRFTVKTSCTQCEKPLLLDDSDLVKEVQYRVYDAVVAAFQAANIRFWCHLKPLGGAKDWTSIAFAYLDALKKADLKVQAVGLYGIEYATSVAIGLAKYDGELRASLRRRFVNIVCGFGGDFERPYVDGMVNIALTGCVPREPNAQEITYLKKYEHVWVISDEFVQPLNRLDVTALPVPPNDKLLATLLGDYE